jgi:hypothetical protein
MDYGVSDEAWISVPTEYKGVRYRSRLEARWAIVFDRLKIEAKFEPQSFIEHGLPYIPDFYLPSLGVWVEIKPTTPNSDECKKAHELHRITKEPVYIFSGYFDVHPFACTDCASYHHYYIAAGINICLYDSTQSQFYLRTSISSVMYQFTHKFDDPPKHHTAYDTITLVFDYAKRYRFGADKSLNYEKPLSNDLSRITDRTLHQADMRRSDARRLNLAMHDALRQQYEADGSSEVVGQSKD